MFYDKPMTISIMISLKCIVLRVNISLFSICLYILQVTIKNLWEGKNIKESIDERRFHHQLEPMRVTYEYGITKVCVITLL